VSSVSSLIKLYEFVYSPASACIVAVRVLNLCSNKMCAKHSCMHLVVHVCTHAWQSGVSCLCVLLLFSLRVLSVCCRAFAGVIYASDNFAVCPGCARPLSHTDERFCFSYWFLFCV
jgi:hypothetical protein